MQLFLIFNVPLSIPPPVGHGLHHYHQFINSLMPVPWQIRIIYLILFLQLNDNGIIPKIIKRKFVKSIISYNGTIISLSISLISYLFLVVDSVVGFVCGTLVASVIISFLIWCIPTRKSIIIMEVFHCPIRDQMIQGFEDL